MTRPPSKKDNPAKVVPDDPNPMLSPEEVAGRCNAVYETAEDEEQYCLRYPASEDGNPIYEDARCYECGPDDGEDPPNITHGLYTMRSKFYKRMRPREQAWIDTLVADMVNSAPFDRNDLSKLEMVRQIAIDIAKIRYANAYMSEEGMVQRQTVDTDDEGYPIKEDVENIMNIPIDRLERNIMSRMKDLGIVTEDAEHQQADEIATLAEVLATEDNEEEIIDV